MAEEKWGETGDDDVHLREPSDGGSGQWSGPPAVLMSRSVQETVWNHAESDTEREVGGILVGRVSTGPNGTLIQVETALPAQHAESSASHVTFTHESWSEWYRIIDEHFPGLVIVGWYHSHPNFGIFLSAHDQFIQQHFFTQPWHVALVVDPIRREWGCFGWDEGKIMPLAYDRLYQTLERRPAEVKAASEGEAIPVHVLTPPSSTGKTLGQRLWWLGWGVALALFVVLVIQAYGFTRAQASLDQTKTQIDELKGSVAALQKTINVLAQRERGRWYVAAADISLNDVCRDEYGREDLAVAIQAINELQSDRVKRDQHIWLPAPEVLLPPPTARTASVEGKGIAVPQPYQESEPGVAEDTLQEVGPPSASPSDREEAKPGVFR